MNKYKLIILCGKAGAGKDYLLHEIYKKRESDLNLLISDTTRPQRTNEENHVNYNFLTEEEFKQKQHIETSCFNNWFYGIPIDALDKEKVNIGILNLSGIRYLYQRDDMNIKIFYISTTDKNRILRQINREQYPDIAEICRRFLADEEDFKNLYKYPFQKLRNTFAFDSYEAISIIEEAIDELKLIRTE